MRLYRFATAVAIAAAAVLIPSSAPAAVTLRAPERVRVTNVTATQISFAWVQNTTGAVGTIRARVFRDDVHIATTPLVRHTSAGLVPGATYTFRVVASDAAGNTSPPSRTLTVTTRAPGSTPPGPANLRATEVAPARVQLTFDQPDDSWDVSGYQVYDGGTQVAFVHAFEWTGFAAITLAQRQLAPESAHSYSVQALRAGFGASAPSNTVALVLPARTDTVAPSTPTGFAARTAVYACFSVNLSWAQSSDNADAPAALDYQILVNGVFDHWVRGAGASSIGIVPVGNNTITVRAVDSSGNASAAATAMFLRDPSCTDDA